MLQATIDYREEFVPPEQQSRWISSTTPAKQRKENIIQQRLVTAERGIAILQIQVHELKSAYFLLEKRYAEKVHAVSTKEQTAEEFHTT